MVDMLIACLPVGRVNKLTGFQQRNPLVNLLTSQLFNNLSGNLEFT